MAMKQRSGLSSPKAAVMPWMLVHRSVIAKVMLFGIRSVASCRYEMMRCADLECTAV